MKWGMPVGKIAVILLFLTVAVVFGNLWFHLVESALEFLKRPFARRKEPPSWHPLPPDQEDEKND